MGGPVLVWPLDAAQLRTMRLEADAEERPRLSFCLDEAGRVVGHGQLVHIRRHAVGRLARICVAPEARGRGVGKRLVGALVQVGFSVLECRRLELNVYARNLPARALYRACGFKEEVVRRGAVLVEGEREDVVVMGRLASESGGEAFANAGAENCSGGSASSETNPQFEA